jgi:WD40 repeat protein
LLQPHAHNIKVDDILSIRLSENALKSLIAIEDKQGQVWIIDLTTQQVKAQRNFERFANSISLDYSGRYLALGYYDGTLEVWDILNDIVIPVGNLFEP